jgi:hypothetical protein
VWVRGGTGCESSPSIGAPPPLLAVLDGEKGVLLVGCVECLCKAFLSLEV